MGQKRHRLRKGLVALALGAVALAPSAVAAAPITGDTGPGAAAPGSAGRSAWERALDRDATSPAPAPAPKGSLQAAVAPSLSATPSTGLLHGQSVALAGSGFASGELVVAECGANPTGPEDCDLRTATFVSPDPAGDIALDFSVSRTLFVGWSAGRVRGRARHVHRDREQPLVGGRRRVHAARVRPRPTAGEPDPQCRSRDRARRRPDRIGARGRVRAGPDGQRLRVRTGHTVLHVRRDATDRGRDGRVHGRVPGDAPGPRRRRAAERLSRRDLCARRDRVPRPRAGRGRALWTSIPASRHRRIR